MNIIICKDVPSAEVCYLAAVSLSTLRIILTDPKASSLTELETPVTVPREKNQKTVQDDVYGHHPSLQL